MTKVTELRKAITAASGAVAELPKLAKRLRSEADAYLLLDA